MSALQVRRSISAVIYQRGEQTIQKTVLNEVYELLAEHEFVASESEFSRDWLCRDSSYMRGLRFHGQLPSIASIALCASRLQHYGARLTEAGLHEELAEQFIDLSEACHRQINARCTAHWIDALEMGSAA